MPPRRIGRYVVFGELAAGGMATVYVGRLLGAAGFARRVAIKSLHAQFAKDPDFLSMFLDEARVSGSVLHPNAVQILDVISTTTELHLVMEYIEGESLSRVVRSLRAEGKKVPVGIAVAIIIGVLEGLHAAHEARSENGQPLCIVHRDVSPQNVLVGIDGVPRILDFGIAKAVGRMQTTRGDQLKGKLAYMAPEQLSHEPLDRRTDIYATGIVLWELLTGGRLFQAGDEISTFKRALEHEAPPPSSIDAAVPPELDQAVLRALRRPVDERYATAREFAVALENTRLAASTRQLSEWLVLTVGTALAERATRIADYEANLRSSTSASSSPSDDAEQAALPTPLADRLRSEQAELDAATALLEVPKAPTPQRPVRRRSWLWPASIAATLVIAMLAFAAERAKTERAVRPENPAAATNAGLVHSATSVQFSSVPPGSTAEVAAKAVEKNSPAAGKQPRSTPRRAKPVTTAVRRDCETPFKVDAHGVRVPKLECL